MKIAKIVLISLCGVLAVLGQEKKSEERAVAEKSNTWPVKVFQVKHVDVGQLNRIFQPLNVSISFDRDLKVLSVRAPKDILAVIEETIQRLDVPPPAAKNIELNAYLVLASPEGTISKMPAELAPVIKQLKTLFSYQAFRLLGALTLRGRDGQGERVHGSLPGLVSDPALPLSYEFRTNSAAISSDGKDTTIRVDQLLLSLSVPIKQSGGQWQFQEAQIQTSVDVREGQKVVVGKANIDNADNALILVLTAKVID